MTDDDPRNQESTMNDVRSGGPRQHKRKLRNYLLDVSLQLRYTGFIIAIAVLLTAGLGYEMYKAVRDTSKVIWMTGLVDPASAGELQAQFSANDRTVLLGIVGFGVLLVLSIAGAGIFITHKVAGPLYSIGAICGRVKDNKLSPSLRQLRKGDELQDFYASFRDMYEALRARVARDVEVLNSTIATLEAMPARTREMDEALSELRTLKREKEQSLEPPLNQVA
jgi:uncharacterized membrane protein